MDLQEMLAKHESINLEDETQYSEWRAATWMHDLEHLVGDLSVNIKEDLPESIEEKLKTINTRMAAFKSIENLRKSPNTCLLYTSPSPRD